MKAADRLRGTFGYIAVFAVSILAHVEALHGEYTLDDSYFLMGNRYLENPEGLLHLLTHGLQYDDRMDAVSSIYYRPAAMLATWIVWQLSPANPVAQHAANIGLHALISVAGYALLRSYGTRSGIALYLGTLFAVHPVGVTVVTYISGRHDLLGWAVALPALILVRTCKATWSRATIACLATFTALLCREFFACLAVLTALSTLGNDVKRWKSEAKSAFVVFAAGLGGFMAYLMLKSRLGIPSYGPAFEPERMIGITAITFLRTLKTVIAPTDLTYTIVVYPLNIYDGVLTWVGLLAAGVLLFRRIVRSSGHPGQCLLGAVILAASVLMHSVSVVQDGRLWSRYSYETLVGVTLLIAAVTSREDGAPKLERFVFFRRIVPALGCTLVLLFTVLTHSLSFTYGNQITLDDQVREERPFDPVALFVNANRNYRTGNLDQAYPYCMGYEKLTMQPTKGLILLCIGEWAARHGKKDLALEYFRRYAYERTPLKPTRVKPYILALRYFNEEARARAILTEWLEKFPQSRQLRELETTTARASLKEER